LKTERGPFYCKRGRRVSVFLFFFLSQSTY
jgi:hypothetical protein